MATKKKAKPKLNQDGTVRGIAAKSYCAHGDVRKILSRYGKVTTHRYSGTQIVYRVNGDDAILINNASGYIVRKYSLRPGDVKRRAQAKDGTPPPQYTKKGKLILARKKR